MQPIQGLLIRNNFTYKRPESNIWAVRIGYQAPGRDVQIEGNYFVGGQNPVLNVNGFQQATVTGNTLVGSERLIAFENTQGGSYASDGNQLHRGGFSYSAPGFPASGLSLSSWRNLGFDRTSNYSASTPTTNFVAVRPNRYETGRAHIVVYNWEALSTVAVDLSSSGLVDGQSYEVRDAQNFLGPAVATGTYSSSGSGRFVNLPTQLTAVGQLVGSVTHFSNTHTPSTFNAFVVLPRP